MSPHSRYHIPFPSNFLSLNKPINRSTTNGSPSAAVEPHNFLSNRPVVGRHSSISSVSSAGSPVSEASSPSSVVASPVLAPATPAFLTLNRKHTAPPSTVPTVAAEKSSFLSNRN